MSIREQPADSARELSRSSAAIERGNQTYYYSLMLIHTIREMLEREPFHPFCVRTSSGVAYAIRNPGLAVIQKSQILIAEPRSDRFAVVPFLHIAGAELMRNGSAHDRRRPRR